MARLRASVAALLTPPRKPRPISAYVRLLTPLPVLRRRGGPIKRLNLWRQVWTDYHSEWTHDVAIWLIEQRRALADSLRVGPYALEEYRSGTRTRPARVSRTDDDPHIAHGGGDPLRDAASPGIAAESGTPD